MKQKGEYKVFTICSHNMCGLYLCVLKRFKNRNCLIFCTKEPVAIFAHKQICCQAASLRQLEEENHEAAARLEEVVFRGDMLLEKIQSALADIAQSQLRTRNGAPSQPSASES